MSQVHFKGKRHAAIYKKYRPDYPPEIKNHIKRYIIENNPECDFGTMLDVACGSGQATLMWINDFRMVHGIDISAEHIKNAPTKYPNVVFSIASATDLKFHDCSIDLITVASGLHWFDRDSFYTEAQRVLKPGGVLAAFTHNMFNIKLDDARANEVLSEFYRHLRGTIHWTNELQDTENSYRDFVFPLQNMTRIYTDFVIDTWTTDDFIGLLSSLSCYQSFLREHSASGILETARQRLDDIFDGRKPKMTIPVFLLMGHKPYNSRTI